MIDQSSIHIPASGIPRQSPMTQGKTRTLRSTKNIRYLLVAAICAIVNNLLLIALVKSGFNYFTGIWLAYVPMVLFGYALHVTITFRITGSSRTLLRYALVMLANYPLWIASLFVLCSVLKLPIVVAAPVGTVIAFVGNYLATHWAVMSPVFTLFGSSHNEDEPPVDKKLLEQFLSEYSFQPATALWRAIELPALIELRIPSGRGIDVGCGEGKLTAILLNRIGGRDLVGVDPDPREAEESRRRGAYTTVHGCAGSAVPEPDASFDFAISNSVLEHIPDLDPVLAETARVLRIGGTFFLTVPHAGFHAQLRGPLLPGASRTNYERQLDRRLAHLRYPSAADWVAMLDRHGFAVETIDFYLDRSQVRRWETISRFTSGVLTTLSGGRLHPIVLQRVLGLRQIQNQRALPAVIASFLAAMLTLGLRKSPSAPNEQNTGCVAICCRRR